ncbi:lipocalin family protein [Rariglobus hedericola]|nr:lipocalin family protein [Rariglobus hedericola]
MKNTTPKSLATVKSVDLDRYMGRWHVIAYTPNFFEDGKVATSDNYVKHADGTMAADYVFRRKNFEAPEKTWHGKAWVTNTQTNAEWKVRLFWPFTSDYLILELDADYRWAVVASNGGKLVWVLAREHTLPDSVYTDLLKRIDARGLDSSRLARVPQPGS